MNDRTPVAFQFFRFFVFLLPVVFLVLEVRLIRSWKGWWRVLAAIPAVVVTGVALKIVLDIHRHPTSNNFWPLEILMVLVLGLVALAILAAIREK